MDKLKLKDHLYYARIIANSGIYDVCELIIRTIANDYIVHWIVSYFMYDRELALDKVQLAEDGKREINNETYYEES